MGWTKEISVVAICDICERDERATSRWSVSEAVGTLRDYGWTISYRDAPADSGDDYAARCPDCKGKKT